MARINVFDILGPVMVGPSSSHTAGAVRLGLMARKILGDEPREAKIILHGSFAETGKGHGTDLALVAGLLGMLPDDERIPRAMEMAAAAGLKTVFSAGDLGDVHPNSVRFDLKGATGHEATVLGCSIGGGQIEIRGIDEFPVMLRGDYPTLVILHQDLPGVVAQVTAILAAAQINIAEMRVSREKKGAVALTVVEMDQKIDPAVAALLGKMPVLKRSMTIDPLV
ncbi:L-Serine ammonia-lyase [Acididesulfobacillus acetoxydans]|uniref:L-serine deaminase n=1 Tax=Acididesulfobacillus acetoxydans TaxID=1561005 RepID=A0A8S0WQN3_9FIRM|nr:L-serine ammonia-lyase, iron-sulfur-dependent subunit beta [Acididesulfobacillus acetoxydans]CAA7602744.1 L-Serine ammonia-lyase [Acididesulfobacillus acetoxydans]CEJ06399.1 L-serine dehydratase, beta chain [Acididesulfobacillus acetoxydans]